MIGLVLRRVTSFIPVLVLTSMVVFSLIHLTPGDPVDTMMADMWVQYVGVANTELITPGGVTHTRASFSLH